MMTFVYRAKKNTAETVTGKITAQSQDEAIELIHQLGLLPVSVRPQFEKKVVVDKSSVRKIKSKDVCLFSTQLSNLLKSGLSLVRALDIIIDQTQDLYFKQILSDVYESVRAGRSFSDSLKAYPTVFDSLYVIMVHAGEEGGALQMMLLEISQYQRRQEAMASKVRGAMVYPAFMLAVGCATVYFILTFVLPKMSALFNNLGEKLPLPTVILLSISNALHKGGIVLVIGLVLSVLFFLRWKDSPKGRYAFSQYMLHVPLLGEVHLKSELAKFCRTLEMLLKNGVSMTSALTVSIPILSNEIIKSFMLRSKEELLTGGSFGESLKKIKELPRMMGQLISVGEESGNLSSVLESIAESYEEETEGKIKIMTTLLEPVMILAVGLVVGLIVFAILLPIFQFDALAS